jgi:hypothetical protein
MPVGRRRRYVLGDAMIRGIWRGETALDYYPEDGEYLLSFAPRVDHYDVALSSSVRLPDSDFGPADA